MFLGAMKGALGGNRYAGMSSPMIGKQMPMQEGPPPQMPIGPSPEMVQGQLGGPMNRMPLQRPMPQMGVGAQRGIGPRMRPAQIAKQPLK